MEEFGIPLLYVKIDVCVHSLYALDPTPPAFSIIMQFDQSMIIALFTLQMLVPMLTCMGAIIHSQRPPCGFKPIVLPSDSFIPADENEKNSVWLFSMFFPNMFYFQCKFMELVPLVINFCIHCSSLFVQVVCVLCVVVPFSGGIYMMRGIHCSSQFIFNSHKVR